MKKSAADLGGTVKKLEAVLAGLDDVVFAYLHGSFIGAREFRDVDVAVYLNDRTANSVDTVEYEISLSLKLEKTIGLPMDVKVLNQAPLSFRYHATAGRLLLTRDESVREDFLRRTWTEYFDFAHLARIYQEDLTRT